MITRVKIAPVERWCPPARNAREGRDTSGLEIEIDTDTVSICADCLGRSWNITDESFRKMADIAGIPLPSPMPFSASACEHMLEIGD